MLMFVKAFPSIDLIRHFLKSKNLLGELLMVEAEMGNYLEAADIARAGGNLLLEAEMVENASQFEKAARLILYLVTMNSLRRLGRKWWPMKKKKKLLMKAKVIAEKVSCSFYSFVCTQVDILADGPKNLVNLTKALVEVQISEASVIAIFILRKILDVHLHSEPSKYFWESEVVLDCKKHAFELLSQDVFSVETLMYIWNLWRVMVLCVIDHLQSVGPPDLSCVVLSSNPSWLRSRDRSSLLRQRNLISMNIHQCLLSSEQYWSSELSSVGYLVLEALEALHSFAWSCKPRHQNKIVHGSKNVLSSFSKGRIILCSYEVAKFLTELESISSKKVGKFKRILSLAQKCFSGVAFHLDWRRETMESMIGLHENGIAREILEQFIFENVKPINGTLTSGQIGRMVMALFLSGQLSDTLFEKMKDCLDHMPDWKEFIFLLKTFLDFGSVRFPLICKLQEALQSTFSVNWSYESDYMSPQCYVFLAECLIFFASSCLASGGHFFGTRSSLFEMLRCHGCKGYLDLSSPSVSDTELQSIKRSLELVITMLTVLLRETHGIQDWQAKSLMSKDDYELLITRVVINLSLAHLNTGRDPSVLRNFLLKNLIYLDLTPNFSEKLRQAMAPQIYDRNCFLRMFTLALAVVENPLVIICSQESGSRFLYQNALVIGLEELSCRENVIVKLFPKNLGNAPPKRQASSMISVNDSSSRRNLVSVGNKQEMDDNCPPTAAVLVKKDPEIENGILNSDDPQGKYSHFFGKVEAFKSGKIDDMEDVILILESGITLLKHEGPPKGSVQKLLRQLNDELKLLSTMKKEDVEPFAAVGEQQAPLLDLNPRLRLLMDSLLSHLQETAEEAPQIDENIDEVEECKQDTSTVNADEATTGCSKNQGKNKREKKHKRSSKKGKGKGKEK